MSKLADQLAATPPTEVRVKRGPTPTCLGVYAPDLDDSKAVLEFQQRPTESWATTHRRFDALLGVTQRIPTDKFRYHWKRRCGCWPADQRVSV